MNDLETALAALDERLAEAQRNVDLLAKALRRLRQAAGNGNITDIEKGLEDIPGRARTAATSAEALPPNWTFDARTYIGAGYVEEVLAAARAANLQVIERDGRLYAFPLVLRIEAREAAVRVGRKRERRLRPKELVKHLAAMQKRPQRLSEQRFLDVLYRAYRGLVSEDWRRTGGEVTHTVPLADIHAMLTLLPGADYPIEEFGRDLLLLDRQPDLRTRDGYRFTFPGSSMARERVQRIVTYDEQGRERTYIGIAFVKEP